MQRQSSKEVAEELAQAVADAENREEPISVADFRRLFLKGLAAMVRETDSIAYRIREMEKRR